MSLTHLRRGRSMLNRSIMFKHLCEFRCISKPLLSKYQAKPREMNKLTFKEHMQKACNVWRFTSI